MNEDYFVDEINQFTCQIREIYQHLADEQSKLIFKNRLLYSLTGDISEIRQMVDNTDYGKKFLSILDEHKAQIFAIYGAGYRGTMLAAMYPEISWRFYMDKKIAGMDINKIPVIKPETINKQYRNTCIIISNLRNCEEIRDYLLTLGFQKENILILREIEERLVDGLYFGLDELPHVQNEVFLDCGCFDGSDSLKFAMWSGEYKKIYAFEPSTKMCIVSKEKLKTLRNTEIVNKGVYSKTGRLNFFNTGDCNSTFNDKMSKKQDIKEEELDVIAIDDLCGENATFIKMDIEGLEYEALKGAERTIQKNRPKLAISIYHNNKDILELPVLILSLRSDYKLYLRHYSLHDADTVLYAI